MPTTVHRFEITPKPGCADPIGAAVLRDAGTGGFPVKSVRATHVYLMEGSLTAQQQSIVAAQLLADPVTEIAAIGATPALSGEQIIEVHPLPGVMDPVAHSVQNAVRELIGVDAVVSTGWRYDVAGLTREQAAELAKRLLANPVIQRVVHEPLHPKAFPRPGTHEHEVRSIAIINLSDAELTKLSRDAHLFLSLDEMKAIQAEYRTLGREPRDIELETLAQTWSEHCVHKTLKSTVRYRGIGDQALGIGGKVERDPIEWTNRPGHTINPDGSVTIHNLLKSTVAAATHELIAEGIDWTLSVFKDNSGVIALDDHWGVCIKVETHNHPSAIEPYGGAATGIGGCIRDVIGTGLGAMPIASTDVFCVAHPDLSDLPPGTLPPRRILSQVVAGVRDYGNRMGIPTVNGGVSFDNRYVGNPLVYCGCIGLIPRHLVHGKVGAGDRIIALGGRTGRDGIHGATFSSAELEHTAADEFAHAVQIGNAIEEKRVLDAIMRARSGGMALQSRVCELSGATALESRSTSGPLYTAMTDCGAGGFSSAIGEMGKDLGAEVHLERAPLKYPGLAYTEIWISEAQERMVLAVPPQNVPALKAICDEESVELADLGHFGTPSADLILNYHGREVGRLPMHFIHDGIPMPTREAEWKPEAFGNGHQAVVQTRRSPASTTAQSLRPNTSAPHLKDALIAILRHPSVASKHWIIRQYDHEVRGNTVIKPLVGPGGRGPGDAAVIEPVAGTGRGIAIGCGLATSLGDPLLGGDPYLMTLAAIDEAVRNVVCVGADPSRIAILDNFCWPSCGKPQNMASLVRACEGCYDGAKAYRTPFVSGKDSLNNQLKYIDPVTGREAVIEIPPTLLITAMGIVPDVHRCVTSDAKREGDVLVLIGATHRAMGGSMLQALGATIADASMPQVDLKTGPATARLVAALINRGIVSAAHDCSEGGVLAAVAEMLIGAMAPGSPLGAALQLHEIHSDPLVAAFSESPSRYVLTIPSAEVTSVLRDAQAAGVSAIAFGEINRSGVLTDPNQQLSAVVGDLAWQWMNPLDW